jgi:hypothetical protein
MSPRALPGRRHLHVIFGLFLASGVTVGACFLWAVADWIRPQGEVTLRRDGPRDP